MTIKPNPNETYQHAAAALAANGYDDCGTMYGPRNPITGQYKKHHVYQNTQTARFYSFAGMNNFNTQIFSITLKPINAALLTEETYF